MIEEMRLALEGMLEPEILDADVVMEHGKVINTFPLSLHIQRFTPQRVEILGEQ